MGTKSDLGITRGRSNRNSKIVTEKNRLLIGGDLFLVIRFKEMSVWFAACFVGGQADGIGRRSHA